MRSNLLTAVLAALAVPTVALSAAMQSGSYQIVSDSLNAGGGLGTSTSYTLESTVGEQATGRSTSTLYALNAGYQQQDVLAPGTISISAPSNPSLGSVSGLAGGLASTTVSWTVITDSSGGYGAYVRASTNPAMQGPMGASFADYSPAGADPDFSVTYGTNESVFAFSPEGSDVAARFLDNGSSCNAGSGETLGRCFDGFTTTDALVGDRGTPNSPSGTDFSLRLLAAVGSGKIQDSGAYAATITITVFTQ